MQTIFNDADAWCAHLDTIEKRDKLVAFWQETIEQPPFPQEFVDSTEMGMFLLEFTEPLLHRKQYDTALQIRNTIKAQQPVLYNEEFIHLDAAFIEYALYTKNDTLFEELMATMVEFPCEDIDVFLPALRKTALYGKRTQLVNYCATTHDTIFHYDGFIGDVAGRLRVYIMTDWAQTVCDNYLQTGVFDHSTWQTNPLINYFDKDSITSAFEVAFSGEIQEMPEWKTHFTGKGKPIFSDMICYFYRFMHGKMSFSAAHCIWDLYLRFWIRTGKKAGNKPAKSFFRFTQKEFEDACAQQMSFFSDYSCNTNAQIFGANYAYDFLKAVGLISSEEHDFLMDLVTASQNKYLATWVGKSHFWQYGFLANWQKADSMPQATYDHLLDIIATNFATMPDLSEDDNTIKKTTAADAFEGLVRSLMPKGADADAVLKAINSRKVAESDDNELLEMIDDDDDKPQRPSEPAYNYVPIRTEPKIGRNEPCPCGSGKKYKKCCG